MKPTVMRANPDEDNYLLESRVRENRMHGSVGGEDVSPSLPNHTAVGSNSFDQFDYLTRRVRPAGGALSRSKLLHDIQAHEQ